MIKKLGALPRLYIADTAMPHFRAESGLHGVNVQVNSIADAVALPRGDASYLRLVRMTGMPTDPPKGRGDMNLGNPVLTDRMKAEALARDILKRLGRRDFEEAHDEATKLAIAAFWSQEAQASRLRDFLARGRFYETLFAAQALRTMLRAKEFKALSNPNQPGLTRARFIEELSTAVDQALASLPPNERENLFTTWEHEVKSKVTDIQGAQQNALGGPAVDSLNMMIAGMDMMRRYSGKG